MRNVPHVLSVRLQRFFQMEKCCTSEGTIEGIIGYEEQGENGFGYDPIFYLPQYGCTTAQLEPDVKNELSHRGKALRAIKEQLRKYCEEGAYEDTDRQ